MHFAERGFGFDPNEGFWFALLHVTRTLLWPLHTVIKRQQFRMYQLGYRGYSLLLGRCHLRDLRSVMDVVDEVVGSCVSILPSTWQNGHLHIRQLDVSSMRC